MKISDIVLLCIMLTGVFLTGVVTNSCIAIASSVTQQQPQGKVALHTKQRTFSIIKPDATERNLTGSINAVIESAGLRIVAQKRIQLTRAQAEAFYAIHSARPFYNELVDFMISGPVVVQVLEGENAIARYRELMGATNPESAAEGTIRKLFAKSVGENSVHGSDSPETAQVEITQFFTENEIVG